MYDVLDLACTLVPPVGTPVAGDDAAGVLFAGPAELERLECTPSLVETLREWGVLPG